MRLQEYFEREEAVVKRRLTKNEERAVRHVEVERNVDWQEVAEMDRGESEMRAQKRRESQDCHPSSDTEIRHLSFMQNNACKFVYSLILSYQAY